jgi:ribosomally synthesized peptide (two-chain TOMM family)
LTWSDADFATQLFRPESSLKALQNWLGYTCPWNFDIAFEQCKATWIPRSAGESGYWKNLPQNLLIMFPPGAPRHDSGPGAGSKWLEIQTIALASYNMTGDAYPLTCP